jgi:hypothetical protein
VVATYDAKYEYRNDSDTFGPHAIVAPERILALAFPRLGRPGGLSLHRALDLLNQRPTARSNWALFMRERPGTFFRLASS